MKRFLILILCVAVVSTVGKLYLDYARQPNGDAAENEKRAVRELIEGSRKKSPPSPGLPAAEVRPVKLPLQVQKDGYLSSSACRECHASQHESWHDSYHRTMTQVATPETVVAPFDVQLESRGRQYQLSTEAGRFYVTMADPDWEAGAAANNVNLDSVRPPIVKLEVVMTTGSHHMQGYWVNSRVGNMLRQVPMVYLIADRRWVPREDIFLAPPQAHRHFAVWNDNCIVCHATKGSPNFDLRNMGVATNVVELGISCEACHGPGEPHIAYRRQLAADKTQPPAADADPIQNPGNLHSQVSAQICGQCHSYFEPHDMTEFGTVGYQFKPGEELSKSHKMIDFSADGDTAPFWSDGTCRVSGREFSAMRDSACYLKGSLSCISCHSMHSSQPDDQLAEGMLGNQACIQCHQSMGESLVEHTHHAADSSGSLCYNCHMPHTTFGLLKGIRSHRIQSPQVSALSGDHPNACNLCHLDQTLSWTASKLHQWYGQPIEADLKKTEQEEIAASIRWLLQGDAVQRAVVAWHYGWPEALKISGDQWQAPLLAELLVDSYSVVRYVASRSLKFYDKSIESYDYVASRAELAEQRSRLIKLWLDNRKPFTHGQLSRNLLIDPQTGGLIQSSIDQLLRTQDSRDLYLPE